MLVLVILRFPHLVLSHVGDDNRVAVARLVPQIVDHVRGVEMSVVGQILDVAHGRIALEAVDVLDPVAAIGLGHARQQFLQDLLQIADERDVHLHVLVDLRRIDFDVDLLRVRRVVFQVAGHAIVEAHAEGEQQVGILNRVVHPRFAVHAHHAEIQDVRSRQCAEIREASSPRECTFSPRTLAPRAARAGHENPVARENHRPLRFGESASAPSRIPPSRAKGRDDSRASSAPRRPSRDRTRFAARPW